MDRVRRDRRLGIGAVGLALSLVLAAAGTSGADARRGSDPTPLEPDVIVRPIRDVSIRMAVGVKQLRFATVMGNRGAGVLELFPVADDCDGDGEIADDRSAYQRVYVDTDGDGVFERSTDEAGPETFAGCSFFHPAHNHWHFEEFARFRLVDRTTGRVVASASKVSFCIRDSLRFAALPGSPSTSVFGDCTRDSTSGLSVGWADIYDASLAGQALDIRGLPDRRYCLAQVADPGRRLSEADESNNVTSTLLRIEGRTVVDLHRSCG
jgi:hypothetical protein